MTKEAPHLFHNRKSILRISVFIFLLVFIATSCAGPAVSPAQSSVSGSQTSDPGSAASAEPVVSGTLRLWMQNPESMNPLVTTQYQWNRMIPLFYESLYSIDINQRTVPVIAEEHQISADALRHTIKIRDNIPFHNGEILDSNDVAGTAAFIRSSGNPIYKDKLKNISSITVVDGLTIAFILIRPDPFFEYKLCFPILPEAALSEPEQTVYPGTGPYRIGSYDAIEGLTATLFEGYRNSDRYLIRNITVSIYKDSRDAMEAFGNDQTDLVVLNDSLYETYYLRNDLKMVRYPGNTFLFFQLNQGSDKTLADDGKAGYLKAAFSDPSLYEGISELLCIPDPFPFLKTSGIIHESRCGHITDFSEYTNTFLKNKDVLDIYYRADDLVESKVIANLSKILTKNSIGFKLYPSDQKGMDEAISKGIYDVMIRQAIINNNPDPAWLYSSAFHPGFADSATLDTGNVGYASIPGALDALYQSPGTIASESDLCEILYAALQKGPFFGIGFRINATVLSKRIRGTIQSNAFNQYNRIEEMWVWSGH
ncbi:MAG: ABC transporter substrate-binding protein [Saccharofermentanales bacterium]